MNQGSKPKFSLKPDIPDQIEHNARFGASKITTRSPRYVTANSTSLTRTMERSAEDAADTSASTSPRLLSHLFGQPSQGPHQYPHLGTAPCRPCSRVAARVFSDARAVLMPARLFFPALSLSSLVFPLQLFSGNAFSCLSRPRRSGGTTTVTRANYARHARTALSRRRPLPPLVLRKPRIVPFL